MIMRFVHRIGNSRAAAFLGLLTITVSVFFLMGYLFSKPGYYTFPANSTPVALPTAIVFILLGIAIYILAQNQRYDIAPPSIEDRLDHIERAIEQLWCVRHPDPGENVHHVRHP